VFEVLGVVPGAGGRLGRPASTPARACVQRARERFCWLIGKSDIQSIYYDI